MGKKSSKVLVTVIAIVIYLILGVVNSGLRSELGHSTPGILGLILLIALIGALRAIWKKDDGQKNKNEIDKR